MISPPAPTARIASPCQSQRVWHPWGTVHVPSALEPVTLSPVPEKKKIMPQQVTRFLIFLLIPQNPQLQLMSWAGVLCLEQENPDESGKVFALYNPKDQWKEDTL